MKLEELDQLRISPTAFRLLFHIICWKVCYQSIETLSETFGIGRKTVIADLMELERLGLVTKQRRRRETSIYRPNSISVENGTYEILEVSKMTQDLYPRFVQDPSIASTDPGSKRTLQEQEVSETTLLEPDGERRDPAKDPEWIAMKEELWGSGPR